MQHGALAVLLIGAAALGGCSEGVLDPQGPVAAAERLIMFNSTGIMLAIVIPTILATLGTAFWYRASNTRARYLPDFDYSGRLEILVWSIPLMTILLVGGVAWLSSYDLDPPKAIAPAEKHVRVQVVARGACSIMTSSPGSHGCWSPRPVLLSFSRELSARSCSWWCRSAPAKSSAT